MDCLAKKNGTTTLWNGRQDRKKNNDKRRDVSQHQFIQILQLLGDKPLIRRCRSWTTNGESFTGCLEIGISAVAGCRWGGIPIVSTTDLLPDNPWVVFRTLST
jgi:hypothetical protein